MWAVVLPSVAAVLVATLLLGTPGRVHDRSPGATREGVHAPVPRVPTGFSDRVVAEVGAPTAVAWTPDGRMVVTSQPGRVIVRREDGTRTKALNISAKVCDDEERGLVGIAVDPNFRRNHFLYLYYTHEVRGSCGAAGPDPANRVSRFVLRNDDVIARRSEQILVDLLASPAAHHVAGDLEFGKDRYLY